MARKNKEKFAKTRDVKNNYKSKKYNSLGERNARLYDRIQS